MTCNPTSALLAQAMRRAVECYEAGDWTQAQRVCRLILTQQTGDFDALNLLGVIAVQLQHANEAAELFLRAIASKPNDAMAHLNYGNVLQGLKRFDEALLAYERAIAIKPDFAEAHFHRADTLLELKRIEDAANGYRRALEIRQDYVEAHNNRGNALQEMQRLDEALRSYERALDHRPDYAQALYNRANILQKLSRLDDAVEAYRRVLAVRPDYVEAYNNLGNVLQDLKRFGEAQSAYERALAIDPNFAEAHCNRGITLRELKRCQGAVDSYRRALQIRPGYVEAYFNMANALQDLGRFDEALESYAHALALEPGHPWLYGFWLTAKTKLCCWTNWHSQLEDLTAKIEEGKKATPPFPTLALIDSLSLHRRAAEIWIGDTCPLNSSLPAIQKRPRHDVIRIGYFSADYHAHATAYLAAELFERHDGQRFHLVAFSFGPDAQDAMRKRLSAAFDEFIDVRTRSDRQVAEMSRELGIDIAVDLKGFTQDARTGIFSYRAAPIQAGYLGYPGTMGASYIDYIIADPTLIPEECRDHYAEKIAYLPCTYQANDRTRQIACREFSRVELELPPAGFVYCCFNHAYKITPDVFDSWTRILKRVEGSVLWLLEDTATATANLRREAEARGVNAARLIFARRMPLPEHLARQRAADLFLDTLPFNAHTTTSDALWAGLPVLTCAGESFAARVAASLLHAIGLPELVTTSRERYEAAAIELAHDSARLRDIRGRLDKNRLTKPLFDSELFTQHLENAYTQMYERHHADLAPDHIYASR